MQTNLLWTGREYYSLENCLINTTEAGSQIHSTIIGQYEGKIYRVTYRIHTNQHWETVRLELESQHSNQLERWLLEGDAKGNWLLNGEPAPRFNGCMDVDIPLTPFTNTLPINRLKLAPGAVQQIRVIYVDVLAQQIRPVEQQYRRLSDTQYHYENVPNDFEADIEVDELGLVVDYPALFVRTARLAAHYPFS